MGAETVSLAYPLSREEGVQNMDGYEEDRRRGNYYPLPSKGKLDKYTARSQVLRMARSHKKNGGPSAAEKSETGNRGKETRRRGRLREEWKNGSERGKSNLRYNQWEDSNT